MTQLPPEVIAAAQASHAKFYPRGPFVSVSLAQYIVESAWGRSVSGKNNFFGIKANATQVALGHYTSRWTKEQLASGQIVSVVQKFADYESLEDAFDAHATLLTRPHYAACIAAQSPAAYCIALQEDGYATARNYASTLLEVIEENRLTQYDQGAAA